MYQVAVIGTGYVGLVTAVCLADLGHKVTCIDKDEEKIKMLEQGKVPIYEPGLSELLLKNKDAGRISFSTHLSKAIKCSQIIFIAVGTPSLPDGTADLSQVVEVAAKIGESIDGYKIIVNKSTVPVGTGKKIEAIIKEHADGSDFSVVSNPEFLREGSAIYDAFNPDRIVIGYESLKACEIMKLLYKSLDVDFILTDIESAEMIKYASNAFLATKISFINEIANICERVGADVTEVAKGMGLDKRIGDKFLNAGVGYGGSCFPKDTQALIKIAEAVGYDLKIVKAVEEVNMLQRIAFIKKIEEQLGVLEGKKIGVIGLSFKPNTDDVRDAPCLTIIPALIKRGATIKAYDPVAMSEAEKVLGNQVIYCESLEDAVRDVDAIVLLTEWDEFKSLCFNTIRSLVKELIMIDGRNLFNLKAMQEKGWKYISVGRERMS